MAAFINNIYSFACCFFDYIIAGLVQLRRILLYDFFANIRVLIAYFDDFTRQSVPVDDILGNVFAAVSERVQIYIQTLASVLVKSS